MLQSHYTVLWKNHKLEIKTKKCELVKVNVKLSLCFFLTEHHSMEAYWGSGGIAPRIFDVGTIWKWMVSFIPRPLYLQGKSTPCTHRRLGEPQNWIGHGRKRKTLSLPPPPAIEPLNVAPNSSTVIISKMMRSDHEVRMWETRNDYRILCVNTEKKSSSKT
jgi:hypothetical protein